MALPAESPPTPGMASAQPAVLATMLGSERGAADPTATGMARRLVLSGIAARTAGGGGVALISVDGKPVRAYPVGKPVVDGLMLQAVEARRAMLAASADAPVSVTLELKPTTP